MNGAEALIRTLQVAGVDVCFANPGTTEMPLVAALDAVPGVRAVLGGFEGVCTGAADGYARISGRPAWTLLHLGPGLANGLANLHNARRARTPVVNIVGDHARWHLSADAPLTSDIASLARPVSGWQRSVASSNVVGADTAAAVAAAYEGQVATLVVPADCQWSDAGPGTADVPEPAARRVDADGVAAAAKSLQSGAGPAVLFLGGAALTEPGLHLAAGVARATGARLVAETFPTRWERGNGRPDAVRLPYLPEPARALLEGTATLVLVGARSPVAFFGYPDGSSSLVPDGTSVISAASESEDVVGALAQLGELVGAGAPGLDGGPGPVPVSVRPPLPPDDGPLTPRTLASVLVALQPEGAVVVDESITSGAAYLDLAGTAAPHTLLTLTGGAIGFGLPCATGAAVAAPDRPVIALQADGSALYTAQALWTQAREGLNVTTLLCNNSSYRILVGELARAGVTEPGPNAQRLTDLGGLSWTSLAQGYGVPAESASTAGELAAALRRALAEPGPHLVEVRL